MEIPFIREPVDINVKNFILQQHKIEIRNNNFFVRGYITSENSGDSYDTRFTAININRSWKEIQIGLPIMHKHILVQDWA